MLDKAVCVQCPVTASAGMEVYSNTFPTPGGHLVDSESKLFRAKIRFFVFTIDAVRQREHVIFPCTSGSYYTCFLSTPLNEKLMSSIIHSSAFVFCVYQENESISTRGQMRAELSLAHTGIHSSK